MKTYFAYIRVSTVKQGEHGSSLTEQRSAIEAYAQRHGLSITAWFEEMETAAKQGRKEFTKLTNLLRKGKASGVIIHKIDRGARNLKDWAGLGELIDAGIEVLFAHEGLDMQTRGGRLAADIQAVVAADFIRNLRDEVRKGFYGRLKQGYYPLPAPRGYENHGKAKPKTIDPIEGPLVRQAFQLYATGNYSLELLRLEMAEKGLLSNTGKPLVFDSMARMLHNPFYMGLIRIYKTNEVFEGNHPPLVTKAVFDKVQAILAGRQYPRIEKHTFLFRRLVKCQRCGKSVTGETRKGHTYYRCHDRQCGKVCVTEAQIDEHVADELQWLHLEEGDLGDLRDLFEEHYAKLTATREERHTHVERDLALLDQRLARLTDLLIDGSIDKPTYDERKADLLNKRQALKENLGTDADLTFWQNIEEKFGQADTAYQTYISAGDDEKRRMVNLVSSDFSIQAKEPVLSMCFPFDEIKKWTISTYGAPHQGAVRTWGHIVSTTDMKEQKRRSNIHALYERIEKQQPSIVQYAPEQVPQVPKSLELNFTKLH